VRGLSEEPGSTHAQTISPTTSLLGFVVIHTEAEHREYTHDK